MKKRRLRRGFKVFLFLFMSLILFAVLYKNRETVFDIKDYPEVNSEEICKELDMLSPKTRELCEKFLARCVEEGLPVAITETYRSEERQSMLYAQGRTTEGRIVTWTRNSNHTSHRAFDIMKNVRGEEFSDEEFFKRCAEIGKELGLTAGYYWEVRDACHFEYRPWWKRIYIFIKELF